MGMDARTQPYMLAVSPFSATDRALYQEYTSKALCAAKARANGLAPALVAAYERQALDRLEAMSKPARDVVARAQRSGT